MSQPTSEPASPERTRHGAPEPKSSGKRVVVGAVIALVVAVLYAGSLFAYWWFSGSSRELDGADEGDGSETVVLVTIGSIRTVENKVDVKCLGTPEDGLTDGRLDGLTTDRSVRLYPWNTLGDIKCPAGEAPAEVATTMDVSGDPTTWPFDSYTTDAISADVLVGSGEEREFLPARVEVAAAIQGWDISSASAPPSAMSQSPAGDEAEKITLKRALGPLAFDLGICIVLITLPTLALFTAFQVVTRRKEFQMPFLTWYAAMLFATVPLRNILPGAPPPGAWIDVGLVLWVIVALVSAMVVYVIAWYRQVD